MKKTTKLLAVVMSVIMIFSVFSVSASALVIKPGKTSKITASSTANSITLTWNKVSLATGYRVYMYKNSKWTAIKTLTGVTYTATSLTASSTYKFAVRAYRQSNGETAWGDNVYINASTNNMSAISTLKAVASSSAVKIAWSAVAGASGYRLYQYVGGKWVKVKDVNTATRTYLFSGLKKGTTYYFAVKPYAKSTSGVKWGSTKSVKIATLDPYKVTITSANTNLSAVSLRWNAVSGATGYRVYQYKSGQWTAIKTVAANSYYVSGLKSNTSYYFKVRAYKKVNGAITWYTYSDAVKATTLMAASQLGVYRIDKYNAIINKGTYMMTFVTNDDDLGNSDVTMAVRNGYMYMDTTIENMKVRMIYNAKNGKTYMVMDDFKTYTVITPELLGDVDIGAEIGQYGKINVNGAVTSSYATIGGQRVVCESYKDALTGETVKYYFDMSDNIVAVDTVGTNGTVSRMLYKSFTTTVPTSLFAIPSGYAYIDLSFLSAII